MLNELEVILSKITKREKNGMESAKKYRRFCEEFHFLGGSKETNLESNGTVCSLSCTTLTYTQ